MLSAASCIVGPAYCLCLVGAAADVLIQVPSQLHDRCSTYYNFTQDLRCLYMWVQPCQLTAHIQCIMQQTQHLLYVPRRTWGLSTCHMLCAPESALSADTP